MRVKINDKIKFIKENGITNCPLGDVQDEYMVEATDDKGGYLILIFADKLMWCSKSKTISVIDKNINSNWVFSSKISYKVPNSYDEVNMKNIYSPQWMVDDKEFFYNIFQNQQEAIDKFNKFRERTS